MKYLFWGFFTKICRRNWVLAKIWQKFDDTLREGLRWFYYISAELLFSWKKRQKEVAEKTKTHMLCQILCPPTETGLRDIYKKCGKPEK